MPNLPEQDMKEMWWSVYYAIRANKIESAKEMLTASPQLARDKGTGMHQSRLLLHIAASENRTEICELLIERMTLEDLFTEDMWGRTGIHYAAGKGNLHICKLLFQKAPKSIYKSDSLGHTILIRAAHQGHSEVCLFFIDLVDKEYIEFRENYTKGYALLHYVAVKGLTEVGKIILEKYPELYSQREFSCKNTLLHLSAENGHVEMSWMLIEKYPNLAGTTNAFGNTPLNLAVMNGHTAVCKMLIEHFPNFLNIITPFNLPNILEFSVKSQEDMESFSILREECGQVISRIYALWNDKYILHLRGSLSGNFLKSWDVILQARPELINKISVFDKTLLHTAASNGQTAICKFLLEKYPCLINTKIGPLQQTAMHLAVKNGHLETCELLLSYMSLEEINMPNCDGETVLHIAIENYKFKVGKLLISKMSNEAINHLNDAGKTALDILKDLCREYSFREDKNIVISLKLCLESYISIQQNDLPKLDESMQDSQVIGEINSDVT